MPSLTTNLTDTELKCLEYAAASPQEWADNAITHRASIALNEIVQIYTVKALDEGVAIPSTREEIVADAYARGWIKTAAEKSAENDAAMAG